MYFVIDSHLYIQLLGLCIWAVTSPEVCVRSLFDIFENMILKYNNNTTISAHFKYSGDIFNEIEYNRKLVISSFWTCKQWAHPNKNT